MKYNKIDLIVQRLDKLSEVWANYFLNYKACNRKINYTDEVKSNYVADIFAYLTDTAVLLKDSNRKRNFNLSLFNAIGILQIIYIHQDLIDELLWVFKLSQSEGLYKSVNRNFRNELIGHPIRKRRNKLISSVFLDVVHQEKR